jgi:hypothetical protein
VKSIFLEAYCDDLEGEELEVPMIKYYLKKWSLFIAIFNKLFF